VGKDGNTTKEQNLRALWGKRMASGIKEGRSDVVRSIDQWENKQGKGAKLHRKTGVLRGGRGMARVKLV